MWRSSAEPRWSGSGRIGSDPKQRSVRFVPGAHRATVNAVAVLPGGARFVSVSAHTARLCALDGALERIFQVGAGLYAFCIAAMPDGVHFVVGASYDVKLYHVDGTLVHTFKRHTSHVHAVAATGEEEDGGGAAVAAVREPRAVQEKED